MKGGGRATHALDIFDHMTNASPTGTSPSPYRFVHGVDTGNPASSP